MKKNKFYYYVGPIAEQLKKDFPGLGDINGELDHETIISRVLNLYDKIVWNTLPEKPNEGVQVLIKCKPHLPNQYFLGQRTNREMCPWYLSSFGWVEDRDIERWAYIEE